MVSLAFKKKRKEKKRNTTFPLKQFSSKWSHNLMRKRNTFNAQFWSCRESWEIERDEERIMEREWRKSCFVVFFSELWIASLTRVLHLFKKWRKHEGIEWEVSLSLENKLDFSNTLDIVIHKQHYRTIKAYFKYTRF